VDAGDAGADEAVAGVDEGGADIGSGGLDAAARRGSTDAWAFGGMPTGALLPAVAVGVEGRSHATTRRNPATKERPRAMAGAA
jgi:hypothetical protein